MDYGYVSFFDTYLAISDDENVVTMEGVSIYPPTPGVYVYPKALRPQILQT